MLEEKEFTREMKAKRYIKDIIIKNYNNFVHFKTDCNTPDKDLINKFESYFENFIFCDLKSFELNTDYSQGILCFSLILKDKSRIFDIIGISEVRFNDILNFIEKH